MDTSAYLHHDVHLDPMIGVGLIVRPPVESETFAVIGEWSRLTRDLDGEGWEVLTGDDGLPIVDGWTIDGREVVGLYGRDPIMSSPDMGEIIAATSELHRQADMILPAA